MPSFRKPSCIRSPIRRLRLSSSRLPTMLPTPPSASVTLTADADAQYNPLSGVGFYANNNFLGTVTQRCLTRLPRPASPAGNYALSAVATDDSGLSSTSAVVNITVNAGSGLPYGLTNDTTVSPFLNMPTTYAGSLPAQLSLTGVFSDTPDMVPISGLDSLRAQRAAVV